MRKIQPGQAVENSVSRWNSSCKGQGRGKHLSRECGGEQHRWDSWGGQGSVGVWIWFWVQPPIRKHIKENEPKKKEGKYFNKYFHVYLMLNHWQSVVHSQCWKPVRAAIWMTSKELTGKWPCEKSHTATVQWILHRHKLRNGQSLQDLTEEEMMNLVFIREENEAQRGRITNQVENQVLWSSLSDSKT